MRREMRLGFAFDRDALEGAFEAFRAQYNVAPERGICAPDVFARAAELIERSPEAAHRRSTQLRVFGVPLAAAIVAPGTIVFEGHVDETKMGDW